MKRLASVFLLVAACGGNSLKSASPEERGAPPDADWWCFQDPNAGVSDCRPVEADCTAAAAEHEVTACEVAAEAWCIAGASADTVHQCAANEADCQHIAEIASALDGKPSYPCARTD